MSTAAEEIELLERVLFRLGTADTDEQLEQTVLKFLTPVLLKITSTNEAVRRKVMELLTHVNKRLKSRPMVQLPVEALLLQYQSTNSTFLHNFSIIYITMGFPRLPIEKQTELTPTLLNCLEGKPESHQDKLLMIVLPLLGEIKITEDVENRRKTFGLADKPSTKRQLISLIQDILLLPYGITAEGEVPPGMSPYSFKRVIANQWKAEELEQLKKGICKFICSSVFTDHDSLVLLILASADTRFSVATPAIAELSKVSSSLDWTDPQLSAALYVLFLGNNSKIGERKTTGCSARVRQKLLQYLLKGRGKGINPVRGVQVIFDALFGENTNQKCKVLALQFTENLLKDSPKELFGTFSKVIFDGLWKLVKTGTTEPHDVQNAAYSALAQLFRICPEIVNKDLQIVVSYFNHLATAPTELQTSIREALVAIAPAFSWNANGDGSGEDCKKFIPNSNQNLLLAMLAEHAESKLQIVQNVASVFLTTCFPVHFVPARYLLLLIAGERSSLRESMISYLYGVSKKDNVNYAYISSIDHQQIQNNDADINRLSSEQRRIVLPNFKDMVNYVFEQAEKRKGVSSHRHVYGTVTLPFAYDTYIEILDYLRICLWFSTGSTAAPGDSKSIHNLIEYISTNYSPTNKQNEIQKYLQLIVKVLCAKRGSIELICLYDLLNAAPNQLAEQCTGLTENFALALKDVSETTRILVAQLQGILLAGGSGLDDNAFDFEVKDIIVSLPQRSLEHRHGSLLTLGHAFYRRIIQLQKFNKHDQIENWPELQMVIKTLATNLTESQSLLQSAAIKGISLIGSKIPLPLPSSSDANSVEILNYDSGEKMDIDGGDSVTKCTKSHVVKTIFRLMKNLNTRAKLREEAAICLGYLAIGDGKSLVAGNLQGFLSLVGQKKNEALNIAIAQAIVYTVLGKDECSVAAAATATAATAATSDINPNCNDTRLTELLNNIIRIVPEPHPNSRISAAIWLLALVKNCSNRAPIIQRKEMLQFAFTELLSDDSEFVQDVASQGLGLVYSLSDPNSKSDLANSLLDQLIGGRRQVTQVTGDTQIFEEGVLGKTPMGGNITTYKELCSLASDLNQPEMIYKFMQLANHNSAWNSKLGAAFGLKSISKEAKQQMRPYLGKIVPRLYRYKYDPTPRIQNSMISIWDSIVTDSKDIIETYYWEILDELLTNLTHVEWRVRIACCLAVRDLIKRPTGLKLRGDDKCKAVLTEASTSAARMDVDDVNMEQSEEDQGAQKMEVDNVVPEPELEKLWVQLFRVMDDVHEGTRMAAEGTVKALSKICIVAASSNNGKSSQRVASSILPYILNTGVDHTVPEIRRISMKTLSELIETSGSMIRPHLSTLVPCLLKTTGELETPKLSYLSARLSAQADAQEAVDSVRAEAAKQHDSMETLTKCIRYIDFESLEQMTPAVTELMRTTVNLGTKIACAHFMCLIAVQFGQEMTPLVGKLLAACFGGLKDRNNIVRKYNASAIGHLIGAAKEQSIIRLFAKLTDFYFENQSNRGVPQTLIAINKRHHELLKDYSGHILPLIFFAMHEEPNDENESNIEQWKDLWAEVSPGDAGIRMNLDTIIPMIAKCLDNPSWLIKTQSGNAINMIATRLGGTLPDVEREKLIALLLLNISGRTFQGKERLLQALASLSKHIRKTETGIYNQIIDGMMKECRKEEPIYRTHALRAIGNILEQLEEDRFEEVYNMIWYLMDKKDLAAVTGDDEDKTLSADERNKRALVVINLKETVCATLGKAWPANSPKTQAKYQRQFVERCVQCLQNNTRPVQLSLVVALGKFLDRLKILETTDGQTTSNVDDKADDDDADGDAVDDMKRPKVNDDENDLMKICKDVLSAVVYVAGIPHTGLKKEALNIVLTLVKKLIEIKERTVLAMVKKTYDDILITLEKDSAPEIKCRLKDIDDKLHTASGSNLL